MEINDAAVGRYTYIPNIKYKWNVALPLWLKIEHRRGHSWTPEKQPVGPGREKHPQDIYRSHNEHIKTKYWMLTGTL